MARALRERLRESASRHPCRARGCDAGPGLRGASETRLDLAGFRHVDIYISGGLTPDRITEFVELEAPVSNFVVGQYIAGASPIPMTCDIKEIDGSPGRKTRPRAGV